MTDPSHGAPDRQPSLGSALVAQRRGWRAGERVLVEDYLLRYPALRSDPDSLLDLIYNEVVAREERGEAIDPAEYARRFPDLAGQLQILFEVHAVVPAPAGVEAAGDPTATCAAADPSPDCGYTLPQSPAQAAKAAALSAPALVPGYEILSELGRGGMGVVYKARPTSLSRVVALKMILSGIHAGAEARVRFQREAELIARLQHPNIIQIYGVGENRGCPYLALEFVEGGSLAAQLHGTPRPPEWAARMVESLSRAVQAAHDRGVVHRDLKPANVLLTADGTPKITDFGLAKEVDADGTSTGIFGTPSYMAPEQARGQTRETGPAADIYSLGAILYELLTGRPPFRGESPLETLRQVLADEPVAPRRFQPRLPRDLETICLKCLEKSPARRYPTAADLADDLRRFQAREPIKARPVGTVERVMKWVRRRPGRAAGVVAGALLAVGVLVATVVIRRERDADHRAAELVLALATADTEAVPRLLDGLKQDRARTGPKLRELADQPVNTKSGLHARLALLADEAGRADELAAYLLDCRPEELIPVAQSLVPHAATVAPPLWDLVSNGKAKRGKQVRAAAALAALAADDARWPGTAATVVELVVKEDPVPAETWGQALEPVRAHLFPALIKQYAESRRRIESGGLPVSDLVAEAAGFDTAAKLLARYAADRPADLAELALAVENRHYPLFAAAAIAQKDAVVPRLKAELVRRPTQDWAAVAAGTAPFDAPAAAVGSATAERAVTTPDGHAESLAKRQGYAAAVLVSLGEGDAVWPLLKHSPDPVARSYLIARLAAVGTDPVALTRRFGEEPDASARRAILLALGEFPPELVPAAEREQLVSRLLVLYRQDSDPGLHSAIDWLLRQKWKKANELAGIDRQLRAEAAARATAARSRLALPAVAGAAVTPTAGTTDHVRPGRDWFVDSKGQTFAVVRPVEFILGSPVTELGRHAVFERTQRKRIGRTYAIATREVVMAEFQEFFPDHHWVRAYSPDPDCPAVTVTWYAAAEYCNRLSEREGIPPDQWCYERNASGKYESGMRIRPDHLALSGYRLPTNSEWEFACRAGTRTARFYGRGEELLGRYAWSLRNSGERAQPGGRLRPNDLGLFDILGNVQEWVENPNWVYLVPRLDDVEDGKFLEVTDQQPRLFRGGSFFHQSVGQRSAFHDVDPPEKRYVTNGFRVARTLP